MRSNALTEAEVTAHLADVADYFENANVGLVLTDKDGTVRRANIAAGRLAGWPDGSSRDPGADERSVRELLPAAAWERVTATTAAGHPLHNLATTFTPAGRAAVPVVLDVNAAPDGGLRLVVRPGLSAAVPGPEDSDAHAWHATWAQADISPLTEAAGDKAAEADELDDFLENLPAAIHKIVVPGAMARTNQTQLQMLGYQADPDKFLGHIATEFFPVEADLVVLSGALLSGTIANFPTLMRRADGSDLPVRVYSTVRTINGEWSNTRCFAFYANAADAADSPVTEQADAAQADADHG